MVNKIYLLLVRYVFTAGVHYGERTAMTGMDSRIPCTTETRERIKALKRGGETYEETLRKMLAQYDPEAPEIS